MDVDDSNKDKGLLPHYHVEKLEDPTGKHRDCEYFVLDPQHDPIARKALEAYSLEAFDAGYEALATDLQTWLRKIAEDERLREELESLQDRAKEEES